MSRIVIRRATGEELHSWNDLVSGSPEGTPFHRLEWLHAVEATSRHELTPLIGEEDGVPVGVFPLFENPSFGLKRYLSPPSRSLMPLLGPLLIRADAEVTSAVERRYLEFHEAAFGWLSNRGIRALINVKAELPGGAARAALWSGFRVSPLFSYVVDLDRPLDAVLAAFQPRARRSVRDAERLGLTLRASHAYDDAIRIYRSIRSRYEDQGLRAPYSERYLHRLWQVLGHERLVALCVERDASFVTGMLGAFHGETFFCISGAPRMEVERVSINEYLHWSSMSWAHEQGLKRYDLVGANTRHLIDFKLKVRPTLREYYLIESDTPLAWAAKRVYQRVLR